jgi:hypothetical protein
MLSIIIYVDTLNKLGGLRTLFCGERILKGVIRLLRCGRNLLHSDDVLCCEKLAAYSSTDWVMDASFGYEG